MGARLICKGRWPRETIEIQSQNFDVELYLLAIGKVDIVLGMQLLQQLSNVEWNFEEICVEFQSGKGEILLKTTPQEAQLVENEHQLNRISKDSASMHFLLVIQGGLIAPKPPWTNLSSFLNFDRYFLDFLMCLQDHRNCLLWELLISRLRWNLGHRSTSGHTVTATPKN